MCSRGIMAFSVALLFQTPVAFGQILLSMRKSGTKDLTVTVSKVLSILCSQISCSRTGSSNLASESEPWPRVD